MKKLFLIFFLIALSLFMVGVYGDCSSLTNNVDAENGLDGQIANASYNYTDLSYEFNGINSYIDLKKGEYVENGTISFSVKLASVNNNNVIIQRGSGSRPQVAVDINGRISFVVYNGTYVTLTSTSVLSTSKYNNIVVTWGTNDITKNMSIFFNGVLENTTLLSKPVNNAMGTDWFIGKSGSDTQYFNGSIKQVRIYNITMNNSQAVLLNNSFSNASFFALNLTTYYSFQDAGYIQYSSCGTTNLTDLYNQANYTNKLIKNGNIFDLYSTLYIYTTNQIDFTNDILRFNYINVSNAIGIYAGTINFNNFSVYTISNGLAENNYSKIRGYIYIQDSVLNISGSNFSNLGSDINSQTYGLRCLRCNGSIVKDSIFHHNTINLNFQDSDNVNISNSVFYNATGKKTHSTHSLLLYNVTNFNIVNNSFYDVLNALSGWQLDDSANLLMSGSSRNGKVTDNIMYNSETGISVWDSGSNIIIANNTIYGMNGAGIKIENGGTEILVERNKIYNCSNLSTSGAILLDGYQHIVLNNNKIRYNTVFNNYLWLELVNATNIEITNNVVFDKYNGGLNNTFKNDSFSLYTDSNKYYLYSSKPNLLDINVTPSYLFLRNKDSISMSINNTRLLSNPLILFSNSTALYLPGTNLNFNLTLNPLNWSYVYPDYVLTEGRTLANEPFAITSSTKDKISISSTLSNSVQVPIILTLKPEWGTSCENVNKLTLTPKGGAATTYTGEQASTQCKALTSTGLLMQLNPSLSSNEIEIDYGTTALARTILKILIGFLCLLVVLIAFIFLYENNYFETFDATMIVKFGIILLLVLILTIALVNYIVDIL